MINFGCTDRLTDTTGGTVTFERGLGEALVSFTFFISSLTDVSCCFRVAFLSSTHQWPSFALHYCSGGCQFSGAMKSSCCQVVLHRNSWTYLIAGQEFVTMRSDNRCHRRLLQQMSHSRTVHTVDASSQQISRRNVCKEIVYKIHISMEFQSRQNSRWLAT